jgi:hypothetical protein
VEPGVSKHDTRRAYLALLGLSGLADAQSGLRGNDNQPK